jgi:NADH:ubiquinone oxidoreductase subunit 6 (subunit J)
MFWLAWQLAGVLLVVVILAAAALGREKQAKKSKVEQEQD